MSRLRTLTRSQSRKMLTLSNPKVALPTVPQTKTESSCSYSSLFSVASATLGWTATQTQTDYNPSRTANVCTASAAAAAASWKFVPRPMNLWSASCHLATIAAQLVGDQQRQEENEKGPLKIGTTPPAPSEWQFEEEQEYEESQRAYFFFI